VRSVVASGALAAFFSITVCSAHAETVDLALVFAADVSRSVDDDEFKLQRQGYATAVSNPRLVRQKREPFAPGMGSGSSASIASASTAVSKRR
jgi:hypothetical protein